MVRIDIDDEDGAVYFVWLGGMDHTVLWVKRGQDGEHSVTAQYNDYDMRPLYPDDGT